VRADSAEGAVRPFLVTCDVKCFLSTAFMLYFFNALLALCAFFTFSFFFFFVLFLVVVVTAGAVGPFCKNVAVGAVAPASKKPVPPGCVAVVVTAGAVGPSCKKVAVGAVAPSSKKPVQPGYSPFRNLVL